MGDDTSDLRRYIYWVPLYQEDWGDDEIVADIVVTRDGQVEYRPVESSERPINVRSERYDGNTR